MLSMEAYLTLKSSNSNSRGFADLIRGQPFHFVEQTKGNPQPSIVIKYLWSRTNAKKNFRLKGST